MKTKAKKLSYKTWLYLMIFSLSIILLFQFFQIILFEPFYKNIYKNETINLNHNIKDIYFSNDNDKENKMRSLTASANACVLIINTNDSTTSGYDSLGQGCVLYSGKNVNNDLLQQIDSSKDSEVLINTKYDDNSKDSIMIFAKKYVIEDENYLIITNTAISNVENVTKTFANQIIVITFIVLILSIVIAIGFSNIVSSPIVSLTKQANKFKSGDFDIQVNESNIVEIDELNKSLVQAGKDLKRVELLRKELLANVSHDLKMPLTMIKAYAEMIKDISGDNKEKRDEHLDVIINETDNLNVLVNDVLDLTKIQDGVLKIEMQPFDLTSLINQIVTNFNPLAKLANIEIECHCDAELIAIGDKARINEVINNFISNAIKHGSDGKKIIVSAILTNKGKINVEITDFGIGIAEKDIPYIWDRYYKTNKQYKRSSKGSGLGLAINKAILVQHNSDFGVKSQEGKYTKFYFTLRAKDVE